jgi:glycosyltransferase involved in cell wall biosynthesis
MDCRAHLSDSGCDADCPTAGEYPFLPPGAIAMDFQRKRDLLAHGPQGLCAVTPSTWLRDEALASGWRGRRVEAIANGLDLEAFAPGDRLAARRALDLPEDASVLLLACADFRDPRKGAAVFLEALRLADVGRMGRPLTVLTMGREADWPPQWSTVANVRHVPLGFVAAREDQVRIYNAADLTVLPSLADNLPNTLLESLACGTPVCALALGGMADIVTPDVGSLAPEPTPEALARELEKLLENPPDRAVCRARAEERWDIVRQVQRYGQLLRELMERPGEEGA